MIDDVTDDKSSRMNSKAYKALLSTQIQPQYNCHKLRGLLLFTDSKSGDRRQRENSV